MSFQNLSNFRASSQIRMKSRDVLLNLTCGRHEEQDVIERKSGSLDAFSVGCSEFDCRTAHKQSASLQRRRWRYVKVQPGRGHACRYARLPAQRYANLLILLGK